MAFLNSPNPASAGLIVYEPFDYAANASLTGQSGGTGFSGAWSQVQGTAGTPPAGQTASYSPYTVTPAGLTFSDLSIAGNAVNASATLTNDTTGLGNNAANNLGARLLSVSATGTIWASYLVNLAAIPTLSIATGNAGELFNPGLNGNSPQFGAFAEGKTNASGQCIQAYYGPNRGGNATSNYPAGQPVLGTTYLALSKLTNVGTALSAGTPGTNTLWVLTAAQYDAIKSGGVTEAELNGASAVTAKVTGTATTGTVVFDTTRGFQLLTSAGFGSSGAGTSSISATYDEVRYGTGADPTEAGILPSAVPEPTTLTLIGLAGAGLLARRQRRI